MSCDGSRNGAGLCIDADKDDAEMDVVDSLAGKEEEEEEEAAAIKTVEDAMKRRRKKRRPSSRGQRANRTIFPSSQQR